MPNPDSGIPSKVPCVIHAQVLDTKTSVGVLEYKFAAVERKIDILDIKVTALDNKVTALERKVDALDNKVTEGFSMILARLLAIEARLPSPNNAN
jgi:hypothetical protein